MQSAIFPGSFDPPTFGHIDIVERASKIFAPIHVLIAENSEKKCLFSTDERLDLCRRVFARFEKVRVTAWNGLVADFAQKNGTNVILRGVRNGADFNYEFDMALLNRLLAPGIETFLVPADSRNFVVRSSVIKDLANRNVDVSQFVPAAVAEALKAKFGEPRANSAGECE